MTLVLVPCPVCGGTGFRSFYAATIADGDADASLYFGSSRARAGHLPIVLCSGCGLVLTNPQDDSATLARVYSAYEDSAYELEYQNRQRTALQHLHLVMRYQPTPGRILDVGCATGIFVATAEKAGWQATGIDASEWMVSRGRSRCPKATFQVATLERVSFPPEAFQVVTLWDVLEHVQRPEETLERIRRWLAPDGWLFLSMPNAESMVARLMGKHWILLLREHLWYFSPRTIGTLLSRAGFEVVCTRPKLVQFSLANVMRRVGQYRRSPPAVCIRLSRLSACNRLRLRFPIGEMDVVARVR